MVILAVVALLAEGLLTFAESRIFRWKPAAPTADHRRPCPAAPTPLDVPSPVPRRTLAPPSHKDVNPPCARPPDTRALAAAGLLALASLTACADDAASTARRLRQQGGGGKGTQVKIMVGGIDKVIYLPAMLTQRLGYFKDEGSTSSC